MRILVTIWPEAPKEAVLNAQFHDVGEVGTGDAPFPIKADNPVLKREMDRLEGETRATMGVGVHMNCAKDWRDRIKLCDAVETWEFGLDECHLGNRFARLVVERMEMLIGTLLRRYCLSESETGAINEYLAYRRESYK